MEKSSPSLKISFFELLGFHRIRCCVHSATKSLIKKASKLSMNFFDQGCDPRRSSALVCPLPSHLVCMRIHCCGADSLPCSFSPECPVPLMNEIGALERELKLQNSVMEAKNEPIAGDFLFMALTVVGGEMARKRGPTGRVSALKSVNGPTLMW